MSMKWYLVVVLIYIFLGTGGVDCSCFKTRTLTKRISRAVCVVGTGCSVPDVLLCGEVSQGRPLY